MARLENTIADFDGQPVLWRLLLRAINGPKMPNLQGVDRSSLPILLVGRDTVRVLSVCYWIYCNLVEMEHQYGVSGDSGGPRCYNYTADGVDHGWFYDAAIPFDRSLFSKVTLLVNGLGVQVNTN